MKYNEEETLAEVLEFIKSTYSGHYAGDDEIQLVDAWKALGIAEETIQGNILGYIWRYGKKQGFNKKDLLKSIHLLTILIHLNESKETNTDVDLGSSVKVLLT